MAFMKFYVGNEANASDHLDGIYIAVDTKKIYYKGSAYGGEEVDLSDYATKEELNGYLPLSGGTPSTNVMTGPIYSSSYIHMEDEDGYYTNLSPFDGVVCSAPYSEYKSVILVPVDNMGGKEGPLMAIQKGYNHFSIFSFEGVTLYGKTTSDLLNAGGSTTSIDSIVTQVTTAIVNGAPETLDTLNELANALGDDPNFATTVTNQIANKADKTVASDTQDGLMSKEDWSNLSSFVNAADPIGGGGILLGQKSESDEPVDHYDTQVSLNFKVLQINAGEEYQTKDSWTIQAATSTKAGVMSAQQYNQLAGLVKIVDLNEGGGILHSGFAIGNRYDDSIDIDFPLYLIRNGSFEDSSETLTLPSATTTEAGVMSKADKIKLDNYPNYSELLEFLGIVLVDLPPFSTTRVTGGNCMSNPSGNLNLVNALSTDKNLYIFGLVYDQQVHDLISCGTGNYNIPSQYSSILTSLTGNPKFKDVIIFDNTIISGGKYFVPVNENTKLYRCETLIDAIRHLNSDPIS